MKLTEIANKKVFDIVAIDAGEVGIVVENNYDDSVLPGTIVFASIKDDIKIITSLWGNRRWGGDIAIASTGIMVKRIEIVEIVYSVI